MTAREWCRFSSRNPRLGAQAECALRVVTANAHFNFNKEPADPGSVAPWRWNVNETRELPREEQSPDEERRRNGLTISTMTNARMSAGDPIQSCPKKLTAWPMGCVLGGRLSIGTTQSWWTRRDPFALQSRGDRVVRIGIAMWSPATTPGCLISDLSATVSRFSPVRDGPANECDPEDAPL